MQWGCEGIEAAGWVRVVETQHGNDSTVQFLENQQSQLIDEPGKRCKTFQEHFGQLSVELDGPDSRLDLTDFLAELPRLSGRDAETCEELITPEVIEAIADCSVGKAPNLDDQPHELCKSMLGFFGYQLADMYVNWQQNREIPRNVHRGVVTL